MRRATLATSFIFTLALALGGAACKPATPPTLTELAAIDDADKAGNRLMSAPPGLHRLDPEAGPRSAAVVAVHGLDSRGKEWVDPLLALADNSVEVYFFRWNDKQCPEAGAKDLADALRGLVASAPHLGQITVIAHSYGGVISTLVAQAGPLGVPVDLHLVASPIASTPQMQRLCSFDGAPTSAAAESITWHQWRTVHSEDGAFKDLEVDPQLLDLPGLEVTTLPAAVDGVRLGHNRSITFVTGELDPQIVAPAAAAPPAAADASPP